MNTSLLATRTTQQGFSLIEVLVALLVMSVGLLTVAALQVFSLQVEAKALNGTRATLLAADIVDRIRANPAGAELGNYQIGIADDAPVPARQCADTEGAIQTDPCTPEEMAIYDLAVWRGAMAAGNPLSVPSGTGSVEFFPGAPLVHRVTVQWREENEDKSYTITVGQ